MGTQIGQAILYYNRNTFIIETFAFIQIQQN